MIEFTLSRVCLGICGMILLSAVFVPTLNLFENGSEESMNGIAEDIAHTIDRFNASRADTMTVALRDILPEASSIYFKDNLVTIEKDGRPYRSFTNVVMNECRFGRNDIISFERTDHGLWVKSLC